MIKTEELRNPKSCLNKAVSDEPLFVLRANDPVAPQTIRHWAAMAAGLHEPGKIGEAIKAAEKMEEWHNRNVPAHAPEVEQPSSG